MKSEKRCSRVHNLDTAPQNKNFIIEWGYAATE